MFADTGVVRKAGAINFCLGKTCLRCGSVNQLRRIQTAALGGSFLTLQCRDALAILPRCGDVSTVTGALQERTEKEGTGVTRELW